MSHISRSLHDALDETLGFIGRALDRIRAGDGAEPSCTTFASTS